MPERFRDPTPEALYARLRESDLVTRLFEIARMEDLGEAGDLTSRCWFEKDEPFEARVTMREAGVLAGLACVETICRAFAPALRGSIDVESHANDGDHVLDGAHVCTLHGSRADIVGVERTVLNTIGRLSGIASHTARYVETARKVNPDIRILDTRKTTPGLRALEKYAVRCGGGSCHRMGLHEAVLVKDNHIAGMTDKDLRERASIASRRGRELGATFVEIEVDRLGQLEALLELESGVVDIVLLDNMPVSTLREAVAMRDESNTDLLLEASGGVTLDSVAGIASTGVDRISVGALTHSSVSLDVGLDA